MRKATDEEMTLAWRRCIRLKHNPRRASCARCRAAVIREADAKAKSQLVSRTAEGK